MDTEQIICTIIAEAGDCRSSCLAAIQAWKKKDMEQAKALLEEAKKSLVAAHDVHTQLLVNEARGDGQGLSLMLVHASEHLSAAELLADVLEVVLDSPA